MDMNIILKKAYLSHDLNETIFNSGTWQENVLFYQHYGCEFLNIFKLLGGIGLQQKIRSVKRRMQEDICYLNNPGYIERKIAPGTGV